MLYLINKHIFLIEDIDDISRLVSDSIMRDKFQRFNLFLDVEVFAFLFLLHLLPSLKGLIDADKNLS